MSTPEPDPSLTPPGRRGPHPAIPAQLVGASTFDAVTATVIGDNPGVTADTYTDLPRALLRQLGEQEQLLNDPLVDPQGDG
ncbi:hypothetical protein GCM10018790_64290 [Kitasatospora xanthocidica]|uniref:hypothetical protein n=1 Tax=Kitasatospora xanthocidica TaxID=83382 RepID=UPI0016772605|nr:hypothetical protein [Kitasatospora xanthocidica]GHF77325.1 hypothetical protein GCM10018790_64290 [Kitasatospora xanthocidica]